MKVGVISDTHDRLPTFRRAIALFRRLEVSAVFHAGDFIAPFAAKIISPAELDLPLHCVFGNNDGEREGLKQLLPGVVDGPLRVELGGRTIVMHHFIDWLKPEERQSADVVITGHTHQVVNEKSNGQLLLNPGECCGWVGDRCTAALLDLESLEADIFEVQP